MARRKYGRKKAVTNTLERIYNKLPTTGLRGFRGNLALAS